ncbi:MAG TPA: AAA family ATPase, partial [Rubricoccaceae bacterium]
MTPSLHDTLRRNLRAGLVGRDAERALFAGALVADGLPFHVVHVYGPGGVGKTTLLHEFERVAAEAGVPAALLDLRDVEPTPDGFVTAVDAAFARAPARGGRRVLLLDTFEAAQGLDGWLQRVFLPGQADSLLVVVAGRNPPAPSWTAGAAWAGAVVTMPLGNLSDAEAEAFLDRRDVPKDARRAVLAFTHGYPLALALVAERFRQR